MSYGKNVILKMTYKVMAWRRISCLGVRLLDFRS